MNLLFSQRPCLSHSYHPRGPAQADEADDHYLQLLQQMAQTVDDLVRAGGDPAPVATAMTAAATMAYSHWLDPVDSRAALCPQVATPAVTPAGIIVCVLATGAG